MYQVISGCISNEIIIMIMIMKNIVYIKIIIPLSFEYIKKFPICVSSFLYVTLSVPMNFMMCDRGGIAIAY